MNTSDAGDLGDINFDISIQIKEFLHPHKDSIASVDTTHGERLPYLDVPTFEVNILNWSTFREQFCIVVHDRTHLWHREVGLLEALIQR